MGIKLEIISKEELFLLCKTNPQECSVCEWIITHCVIKTEDGYWVSTENLDDSDIIHLEQLFKRKIFKP